MVEAELAGISVSEVVLRKYDIGRRALPFAAFTFEREEV